MTTPPNDFYQKQGKLIQAARKLANMTQDEVAAEFSLSQDVISKYEKGKLKIPSHTILKFSRLYNKPITYFFMTD